MSDRWLAAILFGIPATVALVALGLRGEPQAPVRIVSSPVQPSLVEEVVPEILPAVQEVTVPPVPVLLLKDRIDPALLEVAGIPLREDWWLIAEYSVGQAPYEVVRVAGRTFDEAFCLKAINSDAIRDSGGRLNVWCVNLNANTTVQ